MPKIFISYRREDTGYVTTVIFQSLESRFGRENVFMDVDTIPPGVDFRKHLHDAVSQCDVFLVLQGHLDNKLIGFWTNLPQLCHPSSMLPTTADAHRYCGQITPQFANSPIHICPSYTFANTSRFLGKNASPAGTNRSSALRTADVRSFESLR